MPEAIDFSNAEHRFMEMHTGRKFYLSNPTFYWDEIAYTLANLYRWNGTSSTHITVAEHSIRASYETDGDPLEALLHDVTEVWLGDVPGPWKAVLPDFVKLEGYLWNKFIDWFEEQHPDCKGRLGRTMSVETKHTDWRVLFIEAREVMPSQGRGWVKSEDFFWTEMDAPCYFWTPAEAEVRFLNRLEELVW